MDKCPYCGAETRPGDNFCLNCGNRLLPATPSFQQAQPVIGDATVPAQDEWPMAMQQPGSAAPSPASWGEVNPNAPTVAASNPISDMPTMRGDVGQTVKPAKPATADKIEQPARLILRADNGDVLQEYVLENLEVAIGRAPNSEVLLSKDKLTSRRHATIHYENGNYVLRDERSANGTFVNGQQLEELTPYILKDGDHIGIGEHELIFRAFTSAYVEDMPTIAAPFSAAAEPTYSTRGAATTTGSDDFSTKSMEDGAALAAELATSSANPSTPPAPEARASEQTERATPPPSTPEPPAPAPAPAPAPVLSSSTSTPAPATTSKPSAPSAPLTPPEAGVTFNRLTSIPQPTVPDIAPLTAALATLDGQVTSLQEQLNATQEAIRNHEAEIAQTTSQLRSGVRRVSDRMDSTIADVARSREALAWAELLQLMEDVMNNPRDIEYVTKLARKARELNKVFQIHQSVLNTLAECNSLLRSLIGEDK